MRHLLFLLFVTITSLANSQVASIPFEKEGLVYIPVSVPGEETPLQFVFDTGASTAVMDKAVATRLGITADTKQYASGASGSQEYEIAVNRTLEIGNMNFDHLHLVLVDLQELSNRSGIPIDGIIGADIMNRFVTQFDFAEKQIHLYNTVKDITRTNGYIPHKVDLSGPIPMVTMDCVFKDGTRLSGDFLFDSGANLSILFNTPYAKKHQLITKFDKTIEITSRGLTATSTSTKGMLQGVSLLGNDFRDLPVSIAQAEYGVSSQEGFAGILGAAIINRFDMILDYKKKTLYLKPNLHYQEAFEVPMVGFTIKKVDQKIVIGDVIKDTDAAQKGIAQGDELLSINSVSAATLKAYREILKQEGATVIVRLRKASGEEVEMKLTLQRLI